MYESIATKSTSRQALLEQTLQLCVGTQHEESIINKSDKKPNYEEIQRKFKRRAIHLPKDNNGSSRLLKDIPD